MAQETPGRASSHAIGQLVAALADGALSAAQRRDARHQLSAMLQDDGHSPASARRLSDQLVADHKREIAKIAESPANQK